MSTGRSEGEQHDPEAEDAGMQLTAVAAAHTQPYELSRSTIHGGGSARRNPIGDSHYRESNDHYQRAAHL